MISHCLNASLRCPSGTRHSMGPKVDSAFSLLCAPLTRVPELVHKTTTCPAMEGGSCISLFAQSLGSPLSLRIVFPGSVFSIFLVLWHP